MKRFAARVVLLVMAIGATCSFPSLSSAQTRTLRIVAYNIEDDIDGATTPLPGLIAPSVGGSVTNGGVLEGIGEENVGGDPAQPIDILTLEETTSNTTTVQPIVNGLNIFYSFHGISAGYAMSTYQATETGNDPSDGNGPNALVYNTNTVQLLASVGVGTPEGASNGEYRQVVRYEFAPAGITATTNNEFYIYVSHMKSGTTSADNTARNEEAQIIRADTATLPNNSRVLLLGDLNTSESGLADYQTLIAAGTNAFVDPLNPAGTTGIDWDVTTTNTNLLAALSESDTDIRYRDDYQMMTSNTYHSVAGNLAYVAGTYHTFGNNGDVAYEGTVLSSKALNNDLESNPPISAAQTYTNLSTASDHFPVVADYTVPISAAAGQLSISPTTGLTSSGTAGGPFSPSSQIYMLTNSGGALLSWTVSKTATWVTLSAASGSLAIGSATNITVSINTNADSLAGGSYSDTVSFTNATNGAGNTTRAVSLTVNSPAALSVTPATGLSSAGNVGGPFSPSNQVYALSNTGSVSMSWTASKTATWVTLSATSGSLAGGGSTNITVSINANANSLAAGNYSDTIGFTNTINGAGNTTRAVSLTVSSLNPAQLSVSPTTGLTSSGSVGGPFNPANQVYAVSNTGSLTMNWTVSKTATWVSLSATNGNLAGGSSTNITVSISANANSLAAGSYSDTVSFTNATDGVGNTTRAVSLTVNSAPAPQLSVTPASLGFGSVTVGQTNSQPFSVINTGGSSLTGTATVSSPFAVTAGSSYSVGAGLTQTVTISFLPTSVGAFTNSVVFNSNGGSSTNTVTGSGTATTSSGTLAFWNFDASTPTPNIVASNITVASVTLSNETGSLTYFAGNPSTGEAIASSGFTAAAGPPTSAYSFFAFAITTTNSSQVGLSNISFDDRASSTGPGSFDIQISQQANFSSVIYDSGVRTTHQAFATTPMNTLALTNSGLAGTIFFRIYAYAAGGSGGTWRIDNLNVQGSVTTGAGGNVIRQTRSVSNQEATRPADLSASLSIANNALNGTTEPAVTPTSSAVTSGRPIITSLTVSNALLSVNGLVVTVVSNPLYFAATAIAPQGQLVSYEWALCDGTTNDGQTVAQVFTDCGACPVRVAVSDGQAVTESNVTVSVACAMSVTRFVAQQNFAAPGSDSCRFTALPQLSQCTNWSGTVVTVDVGGAQVTWTLDEKGRGVSANGTCRFVSDKRTDACSFTANLSHGSWETAWAAYGMTNADSPERGNAVTLPVTLIIGNEAFMAEKPLHDTAQAGEAGTAK